MSWVKALKEWNANNPTWCVPRKGTKEHAEVMAIVAKMKGTKKNDFLPAQKKSVSIVEPKMSSPAVVVKDMSPEARAKRKAERQTQRESNAKIRAEEAEAEARAKRKAEKAKAEAEAEAEREALIKKDSVLTTLHKFGPWLKEQPPSPHQEWSRYNDSMRAYRINYNKIPVVGLKELEGMRMEWNKHLSFMETAGKYSIGFTPDEFVIHVETDKNWAREYVYRDVFDVVGSLFIDASLSYKEDLSVSMIESEAERAKRQAEAQRKAKIAKRKADAEAETSPFEALRADPFILKCYGDGEDMDKFINQLKKIKKGEHKELIVDSWSRDYGKTVYDLGEFYSTKFKNNANNVSISKKTEKLISSINPKWSLLIMDTGDADAYGRWNEVVMTLHVSKLESL